jgi:hypothetical protein
LVRGHRFEFYFEKKETGTTMYAPFWLYFLMAYNIVVSDVVTFTLPALDDNDDEVDEEYAENMEYEEVMAEHVF